MKNAGRALCHECNAREKAAAIGKYICFKCHTIIDESAPLKFKVSPSVPVALPFSNAQMFLLLGRAIPSVPLQLQLMRNRANSRGA